MVDYILEMKGITKAFPGIIANDKVDFQLEKGEIHVLLGENGAGKTTLMNVLYGLYPPTAGEIYLRGEFIDIKNPSVAIDHGIGMVHQHFMLVEPFTVAENIILGNEVTKCKRLKLDMKTAKKNIVALSEKYGLKVDVDAKIQDLSVGLQQRVEILKALYRGAEILILDEPTAVLTPQEIDDLANILKSLTEHGKSIILITHKLKEIMSMSDRVTVIRRGRVIDTVKTAETNTDDLAEIMVGRKVSFKTSKSEYKPGKVILDVTGLKVKDNRKLEAVKSVDFQVKGGEIFAIAGVDGNGQTELIEGITGLRAIEGGVITLNDKEITHLSAKKRAHVGLGHIPEDRHKRGLVLEHNLIENMVLGYHDQKPFTNHFIMNKNAMREHAKTLIKEYDVRTSSEENLASELSGGNQQKAIIARELYKNPRLLIAAQPTRGLDVGAIEFVHKKIVEQRDKGEAVLLISLELDEILNLADRIAVIYQGEIVDVIDRSDATERKLGILMTGKKGVS